MKLPISYILLWNCLSEGEQLVFSTSPSWIQSTIFVCIFPALFDKGVFFLIIFDVFLKKILWIVYFSSPTMKKLFSEDWKWCCHFSKGTIFPKLIPPLLLTKSSSHSTFIFKYIHISNIKCTTELLSVKFKKLWILRSGKCRRWWQSWACWWRERRFCRPSWRLSFWQWRQGTEMFMLDTTLL